MSIRLKSRQRGILTACGVALSAVSVAWGATQTLDTLASVTNPADATNGGFWDRTGCGTVAVPSAGHGTVGSVSIVQEMRAYSGIELDLPTTAEREFAARGGCDNSLLGVDGVAFTEENVLRYAWTKADATETKKVGTKEPNGWGLYDFYGNVDEFVLDCNGADYSDSTKVYENPVGAAPGNARIRRGGSWNGNGRCNSSAYYNTIGYPNNAYSFMGFRLSCPVGVPQ